LGEREIAGMTSFVLLRQAKADIANLDFWDGFT
jgi:hypothetical protein